MLNDVHITCSRPDFMSRGGGDGGGIVTTVQDGVSSFVNRNPWILEGDLGRIASLVCGDEKKRDF